MLGMNWQKIFKQLLKPLFTSLLIGILGWGMASCSQPRETGIAISKPSRGKLAEVSPPFVIQNLKQSLDAYQPQVKILNPRSNQVLDKTEVNVKLQINDLSLYKDEDLELGPYVQVMLDNQPYAQIYDTGEPLAIENLSPGTHTLRVFAVRPWHESFKNDGAFAQTTFHVFTQTGENQPNPTQPLLTYNFPQGTIGAEPVLLDFYLTNAPLHLVAREDSEDAIPDWQVRCTINGESFTFDRWEPIYLKGLKPGQNWVQLELLNEQGDPLPNVFNNAVQLITYKPGGSDALARLTRGELTAEAAGKIVDPNYVPPAPEPELEPEVILEPDLTQELPDKIPLEEMPPEVLAPTVPSLEAPSLEAPFKAIPKGTPDPKLAEPDFTEPDFVEPEPSVPALSPEPDVAPQVPISPIPAPVPAPSSEPFKVIIAPEGNAAPVEAKPTIQPSAGLELEPPLSEPDPLEAVKARLEEVFQPNNSRELPDQLEIPAPTQPIEIAPVQSTQSLLNSPLQTIDPMPIAPTVPASPIVPDRMAAPVQVIPKSSQSSEIPDMMSALNRVKGFFENLRKRPEPTRPSLLEELTSDPLEEPLLQPEAL